MPEQYQRNRWTPGRYRRMSKNSREMKNGDIGRLCQVSTNLSPGHISITPITHNSIYHQFYTLIGRLFHLENYKNSDIQRTNLDVSRFVLGMLNC